MSVLSSTSLFLEAASPVTMTGCRPGAKRSISLCQLYTSEAGQTINVLCLSVIKKAMTCGIWFGGFQALMPAIGYLLGSRFEQYITAVDHWIEFTLLGFIGVSMVMEACSKKEEEQLDESLDIKTMFLLAVATSIDALAVGITFAFLPDTNVPVAVFFIGAITFLLSTLGVKIGNVFGERYKKKAEITGGVILILLGTKILLEHLGILASLF